MKVLVACEESQAVCKAFRKRGHEAYSCDIKPCSGGHPEWHIQGDALEALEGDHWDLVIAHPPCTYMSRAGARWMYPSAGKVDKERLRKAMKAKAFFMKFLNARVPHIAVENPRPMKIVGLPAPSQTIQPYQFGEPYSKATHLWLRNLPPLMSTVICDRHTPFLPSNTGGLARGRKGSRGVAKNAEEASKTFPGVAEAMAEQWGAYIEMGGAMISRMTLRERIIAWMLWKLNGWKNANGEVVKFECLMHPELSRVVGIFRDYWYVKNDRERRG